MDFILVHVPSYEEVRDRIIEFLTGNHSSLPDRIR